MLQTPLRLTAIVCSLLVAVSWGLFALDETRAASTLSAEQVAGNEAARSTNPTPDEERAREKIHSDPRELVDDANDILLSPFSSLTSDGDNVWASRTIPAALALLVYGFGLGFLARFMSGRHR